MQKPQEISETKQLTKDDRNKIEEIDEFKLSPATLNNDGTSGVVRYAYVDNNCYAIKIFEKQLTEQERIIESDSLKNITKLKNQHIVRWKQFRQSATCKSKSFKKPITTTTSILVLEGIRGYELYSYFYQSRFSEQIAWYLFRQLIDGLEAIQKAGYAHRDLKLENLMITVNTQGEPILKIIDFGHSIKVEEDKKYERIGGTPYINDPCFYNEDLPYDPFKADIFSAGVVLLHIIIRGRMFNKACKDDPHYKMILYNYWQQFWADAEDKLAKPSRLTSAKTISSSLKSLLQGLLAVKADSRLSIDQIKQHQWFSTLKQPDLKQFINLQRTLQKSLGKRAAEIEITSQYYQDIPKIDQSALQELCKQDQPHMTVDYGFEELYARLRWFAENDDSRTYGVSVEQEEGRVTVLVKVGEEKKQGREEKEFEEKVKELKEAKKEEKVEPEIQIQLFRNHDGKNLALYFTRNKQLNTLTFYEIKDALKSLL